MMIGTISVLLAFIGFMIYKFMESTGIKAGSTLSRELACAAPGWTVRFSSTRFRGLFRKYLWDYVLLERDGQYRVMACERTYTPHRWINVDSDMAYSVLCNDGNVVKIQGWHDSIPDDLYKKHLQLTSGGYKAYVRLNGYYSSGRSGCGFII